jgi:hypothetical protein
MKAKKTYKQKRKRREVRGKIVWKVKQAWYKRLCLKPHVPYVLYDDKTGKYLGQTTNCKRANTTVTCKCNLHFIKTHNIQRAYCYNIDEMLRVFINVKHTGVWRFIRKC